MVLYSVVQCAGHGPFAIPGLRCETAAASTSDCCAWQSQGALSNILLYRA